MESTRAGNSVVSEIIRLANSFIMAVAILLPIGGIIYATNFGTIKRLNYVHIMTGVLWTGIDLFMGFVLGTVLGRMEPPDRANVSKRLIPRMTFLMPVLAGVATTS